MVKSIKKTHKFLIAIITAIIVLVAVIILIISSSSVQTYIVQNIAGRISKNISSTLSIGSIKYTFLNKLNINDLLILDLNTDTLLYSHEVSVGIRKFDIKTGTFGLGMVVLDNPVIKFITDSTGVMNLTYYLQKLKKEGDSTTQGKSHFSISRLEIKNGSFLIANNNGIESKTKIDFNNLRLREINSQIENIKIESDSITFTISDLNTYEKSGLRIKRLNTDAKIGDDGVYLSLFKLNLDSSIINAEHIILAPSDSDSYSDFMNKVNLDIFLDRSQIFTNELAFFIPGLDSISESFLFSADLSGTISELRGRDITLNWGDNTFLSGDFDFSGLPDIQNTYIYIGVNNFHTNSTDIEGLRIGKSKKIVIPNTIKNLGNISFEGIFNGFLTDFVTYGNVRTEKGNISTDISFRPENDNAFTYKGLINGSSIDLGEITGRPDLFGEISINANINGSSTSFSQFAASMSGMIDSVEIKGYKYRDIKLNGSFTEKVWDGSVKIDEENIALDLLGRFDFSSDLPVFDFTMNLPGASLQKLNITPDDTSSTLTLMLTANFKGTNIDNLNGDIKIINAKYRKLSNNLNVKDFTIRAFSNNNIPAIDIRSDFIDAEIRGTYNFATFAQSVNNAIANLLPITYTKTTQLTSQVANNFTFNIKFKNTEEINKIFKTGIQLAEGSYVEGAFFTDSLYFLNASSDRITFNNLIFNGFTLSSNMHDSVLVADMQSTSFLFAANSGLRNLNINLTTLPDKFNFISSWDDNETIRNKGSFDAGGTLFRNESGKPVLNIVVLPTEIVVKNELWNIGQSEILIDTTSIEIKDLFIKNRSDYLLVDGKLSENDNDTLNLYFNGIDIENLSNTVNAGVEPDPDKLQMMLKGEINGSISLTNVYRNFMFESDLTIKNFSMMESNYGNVNIKSVWDYDKRVARLKIGNNLDGKQMFDLDGYFNPTGSLFSITATATRLPVDFLNPLLKSFASGIGGVVSGRLHFNGKINQPVLTGSVYAENATVMIDYLKTRYTFSDSVIFDNEGIKLRNITAFDDNKNQIKINGVIGHKYFDNLTVDLTLTPDNCMVLNTKAKDNELFYGTAYGTGVVTVKGTGNSLAFDISASTGKNTKFNVPLTSGSSVSTYSYISFIDSASVQKEIISNKNSYLEEQQSETFEISIDLDLTPDAEVQLIFDSRIGDIIKGTGQSSGPLNISLAKNGDFKIYGEYVIDQGDYLFTLGNIFNKKFTVQNGGVIAFNGNIEDAEIDINAIYPLKASLYEILQDESFKERINVECHLNLTGKLFNPVIDMDIVLPNASEEARNYLNNAITTDEELSRQFVYLLVMNSFYADPTYNTSSSNTTTTGTTAMAVTTSEMLSNQLSNWLSQISNDFDIGFAYRPGNEISSQEVEFALSTQLLNDRITLNGNVDVRGSLTAANTNNIAGDFDVEVKLTEKIKFKVFNRANDIITEDQNPYTQGFGFFFRKEFNRFKDLFNHSPKGEMKKEDNPTEQPVQ